MTERTIRSLYSSELGNSYKLTRSPEAEPYWNGCREHRLMLPRCRSCGEFHFYPRPFCPRCREEDIEWCQSEGIGEVYTFAVVEQPIEKAYAPLIPYVIAIIELTEGVRMISHVIDHDPKKVVCGLKVEIDFREISPALTIPVFRPRAIEAK